MPFAAVALLAVHLANVQPPQRFTSTRDVVKLDVTVEDDEKAVRGLRSQDFEVADTGVRVLNLDVGELDDVPFDMVAIVQPFAAHLGDQVPLFQQAVRGVFEGVRQSDRLGIVLASRPPALLRSLSAGAVVFDPDVLRGTTQIVLLDALGPALGGFDDPERRKIVLVVSDGVDRISALSVDMLSALASRSQPQVIFLGTAPSLLTNIKSSSVSPPGYTGPPIERTTYTYAPRFPDPGLVKIAETTGGRIVDLRDRDPRSTVRDLMARLRSGYLLSFPSSQTRGWHPVSVKVKKHGAQITARAGYFVE